MLVGKLQQLLYAGAAAAVKAAAAPYLGVARVLSFWAGLLLNALAWVGLTPTGWVPQSRVKELNNIIEHMHRREDSYRQAMRELQEAADHEGDSKKKALRALKKARMELDLLSEELAQMQATSPAGPAGSQAGAASRQPCAQLSARGLHWSVGLLAAAAYWFYTQDFPAIQRKLVFTLLFPLAWLYLTTAVLQRRAWCTLQLYVATFFVLGFIFAHKFLTGC